MLKFLFLLGVALQHFLAMGQECVSCPEGFTNFVQQNKCYKAFSMKVKWNDAQTICEKFGSHLVTITSADSLNPLKVVIDPIKASCMNPGFRKPTFWTAGKRKYSNGPFTWVPKRGINMEMLYTNWLKGEPNNAKGNEDCFYFVADDSNNLQWNDDPCESLNCFVCEVDL